ncbi:hypothetical protein D7W82_21585 [Corallococcus sp. CA049B]|uniref:hypothetical protein n=1 Tax=Corallococcus sp. CA049B TaxID=2316730 RepID=UPI000EA00AB1|nr:hypothetical protein [Corallococcus sp. CA049B]RKG84734.1 hypothetical protein D7W82_21585 [Corallococcus sp. CA049B]
MSNKKSTVPAEMPPEAPAELHAKRDSLLPELEKAAKDAKGTEQQVLRNLIKLMSNTKSGAAIDWQTFQDVKDSFTRYSKDTTTGKPPDCLEGALEWLSAYLNARGFGGMEAAAPAAAGKPAAQAGGRPTAGAQDGFESSNANRAAALGDVPPPPGAVKPDVKGEQQQLDSFKAWMKNPSLGKLKG